MNLGTAEGDGAGTAIATAITTRGGLIGASTAAAAEISQIGGSLQIGGTAGTGSTNTASIAGALQLAGSAATGSATSGGNPTGTIHIVPVLGTSQGSTAATAAISGCGNPLALTGESNANRSATGSTLGLPQSLAATLYGYTLNTANMGIRGIPPAQSNTGSTTSADPLKTSGGLRASIACGSTPPTPNLRVQSIYTGMSAGLAAIAATLSAVSQLRGHSGATNPQIAGTGIARTTTAAAITISGPSNMFLS